MKKGKEQSAARILVVDDEPGVRLLVQALLEKGGYRVDAVEDARVAQQQLVDEDYDVVVTDITMPGLSGIELLKILHRNAPDVPVILMTGHPNLESAGEAIRTASAIDYLCKPFSTDEMLRAVERASEIKRVRDENRRLSAENERYQLHLEEMVKEKSSELVNAYDEIRVSYDFTLEALVAMLDARERATGRHSLRVRDLALILAREMGLSSPELDHVARGTLLHDIGKIAIPDNILLKPGKLSVPEWEIMRTHVQIGYDIVESSEYLAGAAELVLSHHEKYDGSGYPRGLQGEDICLGARIFAVVDAYDAMRSVRIYQDSISAEQARAEVLRCSGTHFDPDIVQVFMACRPDMEACAGWDRLEEPPDKTNGIQ